MGMADLPKPGWTIEMLKALPANGGRYEIIDAAISWQPDSAHPPLVIDPVTFFAEVWCE